MIDLIFFCLAAVVSVFVGSGIIAVRSNSRNLAIVAHVISHILGCFVIFSAIYSVSEDSAIFMVPFLFVLLVVDASVFGLLLKYESKRTKARIWSGSITGLIGIAMVYGLAVQFMLAYREALRLFTMSA